MDDNKCVVCYACDENYADLTEISIRSLIDTSDPKNIYEIHIIYSSAPSVPKIKSKYDKDNIHIILHELPTKRKKYSLGSYKYTSQATYFRFEIPKLITDAKWCIYLDCDIIIKHDIFDLWKERDDAYDICAIKDTGAGYKCGKKLFKYPERYFNAGVLVMNLDKMRKMNFDKLWKKTHDTYGKCDADQGILNICFNESVKILPLHWNVFYTYVNDPNFNYPSSTYPLKERKEACKNPYIVHYIGKKGSDLMREKYKVEKFSLRNVNTDVIMIIIIALICIAIFIMLYNNKRHTNQSFIAVYPFVI